MGAGPETPRRADNAAFVARSPRMPWFLLLIAGLLEVGWAMGLKYTEGFTRPLASVLALGRIASLGLIVAGIVGLKLATPT